MSKKSYVLLRCPSCGRDAYKYHNSNEIRCKHENSCGYRGKDPNVVSRPSSEDAQAVDRRRRDEQVDYLQNHGISVGDTLIKKLLGDNLSIALKRGVELKLTQKNSKGKWGYTVPSKAEWCADKDGDFLPPVNDQGKILWFFEGITDWLKGTQAGLCCTSGLYGCKRFPKSVQAQEFVKRYDTLNICYDSDQQGTEWSGKLGEWLLEKYPRKKVNIVRLPFLSNEPGKDLCDWLKTRDVNEFLILDREPVNLQELKAEAKRKKQAERNKQKQERSANTGEVDQEIPGLSGGNQFLISSKGLFTKKEILYKGAPTGHYEVKKLCPQKLTVSRLLVDTMDDSASARIYCNGVKDFVLPLEYLLCAEKITKALSSKGVKVSTRCKADLTEYFESIIEPLEPNKQSFRNGWLPGEEGEQFVLGNRLVSGETIEPIEYTSQFYIAEPQGCKAKLETTLALFMDDPQLCLALGASAISPALSVIDCKPFTLHMFGDSSKGKTFAMRLAMSLWGNNETLKESWAQSMAGCSAGFEEAGGLPSWLDESHEAKRYEDVVDTVYMFGNQKSKGGGTINEKNEIRKRKTKTWHGVLLSTGEHGITSTTTKTGVQGRCLDFARRPIRQSMDMAIAVDKAEFELLKNNGWLGVPIIQFIIKNRQGLENKFEQYKEQVREILKSSDSFVSIQARQTPYLAACLTGCWLLKQIGLESVSEERLLSEVKTFLEITKPETIVEKALNYLDEMIVSNQGKFWVRTQKGETATKEEDKGETWGIIERHECLVYWVPKVLGDVLQRGDFMPSVVNQLIESGMASKSKPKKMGVGRDVTSCRLLPVRLN